jgi:site-specific DNA-methyltransferase (adenine-specific)
MGVSSDPYFSTPLGKLYAEDCMTMMQRIETDSVDVVFADPPFNLGKDYGKGINDQLATEEYLDWCRAWIRECVRVLAPGGSFWLYNLPKWNIELGHELGAAGLMFRHWVAIDIKMLLPIPGRLYPSHYSLLYYSKGKPKTFDRPRLPIQICRHCGGDVKDYGGHRNKLNPAGINLSDVWTDITPVRHRGTKTRTANQLSEKLLERVLAISSQEGDLVLDPFGGSGTTYVVAEQMHRHWIGSEIGDCTPIVQRLKNEPIKLALPNRGDAGKGVAKKKLIN